MIGSLKPFEEMTPDDYALLGFKCGLEVHQQLLTEKKLFCHCPAGCKDHEYDAEILRHMRPTLSELGEYDGTALMEFKTRKEIHYHINHQTVCTYEMDDTPPFEMNDEALERAYGIAMLLNTQLVHEVHVARKQYLDGSIPTGFQRTAILGLRGWVPYAGRKIGITQISIEEDSCREIADEGHQRVYVTDRLGMPLIETVTDPDMRTPTEAAEVCQVLRHLVRGTPWVRRGMGAGRQDVNVSIRGGTRVEIKGVPKIRMIPRLVYHEAMRQHALLQIRDELWRRGITEKSLVAEKKDVTLACAGTTWEPLRQARERGEHVMAVKLCGFSGLLSVPTQTGQVFSREFSDRIRVIACLSRLPNLLTSESTETTLDGQIWRKVRNALNPSNRDVLILVWGPEKDVGLAADELILRAKEATIGVPSETRQALVDGTTGFERILPGPERMYPDTDLPPIAMSVARLDAIRKTLQEPFWQREFFLTEHGVRPHLIRPLASNELFPLIKYLLEDGTVTVRQAERWLGQEWPDLCRSRGVPRSILTLEVLDGLLAQVRRNSARAEVFSSLLLGVADGQTVEEAATALFQGQEGQDWQVEAKTFWQDSWMDPREIGPKWLGLAMKALMARWRGVVPGAVLFQELLRLQGLEKQR
jgi:glutamyl-tRNA(Gln) amidotransferase subunit E